MNRNYYALATVEDNGKYYASVIAINGCANVLSEFARYGRSLCNVMMMPTKKYAEELARVHNDQYKQNGTSLY